MYIKKIKNLFLKSSKKTIPQKKKVSTPYRVTIHNNITLNFDSDLNTIFRCLNNYGISIKKNTVKEIEKEIDHRLLQNMGDILSKYPNNSKIKNIGEKFLENIHNRNLVILKVHIILLKSWMDNT